MRDMNVAFLARLAGFFYLLSFITGFLSLAARGRGAIDIIAALFYVLVTLLFYGLFKPVNAAVSLLAMLVSLVGSALGILNHFGIVVVKINPLAIFGCYCLLIGYLIVRSTFLPTFVGVLMMLGGLSWLTFASAAMAKRVSPYNFAPGILGEGVLTLWLLIAGAKEQRRNEAAVGNSA